MVTLQVRPPGSDPATGAAARSVREVLRPHRRSVLVSVIAVLAVAVGLLIALPRPQADTVIPVDPSSAISKATAVPGFAVFLPEALPDGWQPNSARFDMTKDGPQLHIGYLAPDGGYVGLEEANLPNTWRFVTTSSAGNVFRDLRTIDGQVWAHLQSNRKVQDSLVWYGPNSVVMVTGTTSVPNLELLAASLHVRSGG
jgi:hypothetical protein